MVPSFSRDSDAFESGMSAQRADDPYEALKEHLELLTAEVGRLASNQGEMMRLHDKAAALAESSGGTLHAVVSVASAASRTAAASAAAPAPAPPSE